MSTTEATDVSQIVPPTAAEQTAEASTVPQTEAAAVAEDSPVANAMYTTETPAVVESADHHLVSESVPITHSTSPPFCSPSAHPGLR